MLHMQMSGAVVSVSTPDVSDFESRSILVVEDDRSTRELLGQVLAGEGLPFRLSASGHQAMEEARREPPAMVLLDVHLPSLSGEALATALRIEHGPDLPILLMSASRELDLAARVGAFAYLQKPFELEELLEQVRRGLRLARGDREEARVARLRIEESMRQQRAAFERAVKTQEIRDIG